MDVTNKLARLEAERKPWLIGGFWASALYIGCLLGYGYSAGFATILRMPPNEFGDFLAGAFAPLAFFWLFIGTRLQAIELKQNSESLMQQAAEMKNAVEQSTLQTETSGQSSAALILDVTIELRKLTMSRLSNFVGTMMKLSGFPVLYGECMREFERGNEEAFTEKFIHAYDTWPDFHSGLCAAMSDEVVKNAILRYLSVANFYKDHLRRVNASSFYGDYAMGSPGLVEMRLRKLKVDNAAFFEVGGI